MGSPVIRERIAADLTACAEMLRAVHDHDGYPSRWPEDPVAWLSPEGLLTAWVATGRGGEVLGHVALRRATPRDDLPALWAAAGTGPGGLAFVARLFVAPAGRGSGAAGALLRVAAEHAHRRGSRAALDVAAGATAAVRLYEREGWQRVATLPAFWQDGRGEDPPMHVYLSPAPSLNPA